MTEKVMIVETLNPTRQLVTLHEITRPGTVNRLLIPPRPSLKEKVFIRNSLNLSTTNIVELFGYYSLGLKKCFVYVWLLFFRFEKVFCLRLATIL